ncbi:AMP-binding protein, partial [Massilia sp. CCM 8695]
MEQNSKHDMLVIARRLAGLVPDKRALFRQRLRESGVDGASLPIVPLAERPAHVALSFAQQRLWFMDQLEPDSAAYNIPAALRLDGPLDVVALEAALCAVTSRHEALRTVFRDVDGRAGQVVLPAVDVRLSVIDTTADDAPGLLQAEAAKPFDLRAGPLLRATLFKLADSEHILALTIHHIVADGWSMTLLMKELAANYAGEGAGRDALPIQYADYALWQQEWLTADLLATQLDYWKTQLGDEHPVLELPADRARPPVQSGRGGRIRFALDDTLADGLRQRSREQGATLFMTTLTAFGVLLHRLSGQKDIRIGVPTANRNRVETEGVIGFFVNTQVMRVQVDGRMTFAESLARVKQCALGAQANPDLPFEQLVEALQPQRNLAHSPLFQVMFNVQASATGAHALMGNVRVQPLSQDSGAAQFDLSLDIVERHGRLDAILTYSTDLFDAATASRFAGYYTNLLRAIAATPQARISELPILGDEEYRQVTRDWALADAVPDALPPVHRAFELQAAATPDAIALVFDETAFSYAELNARANRLAHHLIGAGAGADARVGIRMERAPDMVIAILATLKAGAAYVPLDPNYPQERLAYMADDAGVALLLETLPDCGGQPSHNPAVTVHRQQLAYVMYTSGSTGKPKGVGITHDALARHTRVARDFFRLDAGER